MENIRLITLADLPKVRELWCETPSLLKEPYRRSPEMAANSIENNLIRIYGHFSEDGSLKGTMGVRLWEALPYFTLINMVYRRSSASSVENARLINSLLLQILNQIHASGRHTFFHTTVIRPRQFKFYLKTGRVIHSKYFASLDAYDIHVEAIIQPGKESEYQTIRDMAGGRKHSHPLWVRRYTLPGPIKSHFLTEK